MMARETIINERRRALYVCNHSGGKDSQAMFKWLYDNVPCQDLIIVHAELPGADWDGTFDHVVRTCEDIPVFKVKADKTFFEMVKGRGMWPSPKYRQCTSDLKTAPISKFIRGYCKDNGYNLVYNCIGIRAAESSPRSRKRPFQINKKLTTNGRKVYNVFPIHDYSTADVFSSYGITLNELNERRILFRLGLKERALEGWPFIYTYVAGMSRHSCKICIMSKKSDLQCSASMDPAHMDSYINIEDEINHQFVNPGHSTPSLRSIRSMIKNPQLEI